MSIFEMNEAAFLMCACVCVCVFFPLFLDFVFLWAAQGEGDFEEAAAAVMERDVVERAAQRHTKIMQQSQCAYRSCL